MTNVCFLFPAAVKLALFLSLGVLGTTSTLHIASLGMEFQLEKLAPSLPAKDISQLH